MFDATREKYAYLYVFRAGGWVREDGHGGFLADIFRFSRLLLAKFFRFSVGGTAAAANRPHQPRGRRTTRRRTRARAYIYSDSAAVRTATNGNDTTIIVVAVGNDEIE